MNSMKRTWRSRVRASSQKGRISSSVKPRIPSAFTFTRLISGWAVIASRPRSTCGSESRRGIPSAGMQYWQRKLQRSVTETRRSLMRRPWRSSRGSRAPTHDQYPAGPKGGNLLGRPADRRGHVAPVASASLGEEGQRMERSDEYAVLEAEERLGHIERGGRPSERTGV